MKSLIKAIDVLEAFLNMDEEVPLSVIAKESGLDKSTVNRIVYTWVSRGYLSQSEKRGNYSLGTKFLDFSGLKKKRSSIRNIALPHMKKLAENTRETIILSVLNGHFATNNEVIPSNYPLKIVPDEGSSAPLYCSGAGKILLSNMSKQDIDDYVNTTELKEHSPNTITHPDILRSHLMKVAKEGIAFDDEENIPGVRNVAAGIRNADHKVVAAVGVLGPSTRLTKSKLTEIAPAVMECALEISRDLGYRDM